MTNRNLNIKVFSSCEEEEAAEYKRRSMQTPKERLEEFAILQERCWGEKWTNSKIEHVVSYEKVDWL